MSQVFNGFNVNALVVLLVKNLLAMQETQVQSLGWGNPLEKEMATHSSILAWRFPWTEEPGGLQSMGSQSRTQLSVCVHTTNTLSLGLLFLWLVPHGIWNPSS